jgi:hypothetical protein
MTFLPLGESILPVVLLKLGKTFDTVHAKKYHNGIGVLLGKVTEMAEHLCHCFAFQGLGLVKPPSSHPLWVFRPIIILYILFRLGGLFTILVITTRQWISVATSWQWGRILNGGRLWTLSALTALLILALIPS